MSDFGWYVLGVFTPGIATLIVLGAIDAYVRWFKVESGGVEDE